MALQIFDFDDEEHQMECHLFHLLLQADQINLQFLLEEQE